MVENHEKYMRRCIEIARNGLGNVAPNPLVGAVIVHDNKIIGEGFHVEYGKSHAEVNAINSVKDKTLLKQSTLYVNLEPCSHFGKTPPCSLLIAQNKIPRVVVGSLDSNPLVSGKGLDHLENAGCIITTKVLEGECRELNKRFFTYQEKKRPYIILKWAQTLDGFIDIERKDNQKGPNWITNESARALVHKWRSEEQSIMVGTNTVMIDNPRLNIRDWAGRHPTRVVIDRTLRLPADARVFDNSIRTIVFNGSRDMDKGNIYYRKIPFDDNMLHHLFSSLYQEQILSVLVEGGAKLLGSLIEKGLYDEIRVFTGNVLFKRGIKAPALPEADFSNFGMGDYKLLITRKF